MILKTTQNECVIYIIDGYGKIHWIDDKGTFTNEKDKAHRFLSHEDARIAARLGERGYPDSGPYPEFFWGIELLV